MCNMVAVSEALTGTSHRESELHGLTPSIWNLTLMYDRFLRFCGSQWMTFRRARDRGKWRHWICGCWWCLRADAATYAQSAYVTATHVISPQTALAPEGNYQPTYHDHPRRTRRDIYPPSENSPEQSPMDVYDKWSSLHLVNGSRCWMS